MRCTAYALRKQFVPVPESTLKSSIMTHTPWTFTSCILPPRISTPRFIRPPGHLLPPFPQGHLPPKQKLVCVTETCMYEGSGEGVIFLGGKILCG